jgi:hypothetical protein
MPASTRSRPSGYSARLLSHEKTHSPSGRFHPDPVHRREIRACDPHTNIDYLAAFGAPDNDRKMKESSWLCSQAFIESLRSYPDPFRKSPITMPGESIAFDGNTQSARRPHREHIETAMRRRLSIAPSDPDWRPDQLVQPWPFLIPEGEWRGVGSANNSASAGQISAGGFFSRSSRSPTGGGGLSSRASSARMRYGSESSTPLNSSRSPGWSSGLFSR